MAESYNNPHKTDKDPHFRKNIPGTAGKRDTWMRQRLLRQGSGDSDRGYRSDHEVYLAEKDQYGQGYHDGYASDWEAFLAKQNYSAPSNEAMQNPQYMRTMPQGNKHSGSFTTRERRRSASSHCKLILKTNISITSNKTYKLYKYAYKNQYIYIFNNIYGQIQ